MDFIGTVLKSFSQVFFQNNIILGALIVLGLLIASPTTLLLALIGSITSIVASNKLFTAKAINDMYQYGFNGVLIGAAMAFYFKNLPGGIALTILSSIVAVFIFHQLFKSNIPPLAAPFLIVTWLLLLLVNYFR